MTNPHTDSFLTAMTVGGKGTIAVGCAVFASAMVPSVPKSEPSGHDQWPRQR
jgi:hypothetical protein